MTDKVDKATRSRIMASVKSKNTTPEMAIRRGLFSRGFRYRLHGNSLPGKPDMVFTHLKAVVFVNGCYWHGYDCPNFRMPSSNVDYWQKKIDRNRSNDERNKQQLAALGWRV